MGSSAREARSAELLRLRDWCLLALQVYREAVPGYDPARALDRAVEDGYASGNLAGMRAAQRDLLRKFGNVQPRWQAELDERLRAKLGTGLARDRNAVDRELAKVLERGRIANEREYHLLSSLADDLDPDSDEFRRISSLVFEFESRGR